jgi:hypothetical protein
MIYNNLTGLIIMESYKRQSIIINSCHGYDDRWLFSMRYAPRHKQLSKVFASTEQNQDLPVAYRLLACSPAFKYTNPSCSACMCNDLFVTIRVHTCVSAAKIFVVTLTRTVWCVFAREETRHLLRQKSRTATVPERTVTIETELLYWRTGVSFICAITSVSSFGHCHDMVSTAGDKLQWDMTITNSLRTLILSVFHILAVKNVLINQQTYTYKYVQLHITGLLLSP